MLKEAKFMRECNDNKTRDLSWDEIFAHPILSLAKTLFYQEQELQDRFFIKSLGWNPKTVSEETRTRMTIVDDYEKFRVKLLQTIEDKFQELR